MNNTYVYERECSTSQDYSCTDFITVIISVELIIMHIRPSPYNSACVNGCCSVFILRVYRSTNTSVCMAVGDLHLYIQAKGYIQ